MVFQNAGILAALVNDSNFAEFGIGEVSERIATGKKVNDFGDDVAIGVMSSGFQHHIGALQGYITVQLDALGVVEETLVAANSVLDGLEELKSQIQQYRQLDDTDPDKANIVTIHNGLLDNINVAAQSVVGEGRRLINPNDVDFGDMDISMSEGGNSSRSPVTTKLTITAQSLQAYDPLNPTLTDPTIVNSVSTLGLTTIADNLETTLSTAEAAVDTAIQTVQQAIAEFASSKNAIEGQIAHLGDQKLRIEETNAELTNTDVQADAAQLEALQVQRDLANYALSQMFLISRETIATLLRF